MRYLVLTQISIGAVLEVDTSLLTVTNNDPKTGFKKVSGISLVSKQPGEFMDYDVNNNTADIAVKATMNL